MKAVLLFLLSVGIAVPGISAQPISTKLERPDQTEIRGLLRTPANSLILTTEQGLYRLSNGSQQWSMIFPNAWRVKLGSIDKHLYATEGGQLHVSTDDGESWRMLMPKLTIAIMDFAFADSNNRMIAPSPSDSHCHAYDSTALSYTRIKLPKYTDSVRVHHCVTGDRFLLTGHEYWDNRTFFHYTSDDGATWETEGYLVGSTDSTWVTFYNDSLYETTNRSLHRVHGFKLTDLPSYGNIFKKVFVDCGGILAITHSDKPALSIDGGRTWDSTSLPSDVAFGLPTCDGLIYFNSIVPGSVTRESTDQDLSIIGNEFELRTAGNVVISYYDILGRSTETRELGFLPIGRHSLATFQSSNSIFFRIRTNKGWFNGKLPGR